MTQNQTPLPLLIRYHADITPIRQLPQGDWIDLRAAERVEMKAGEYRPISLGVSMRLPAGYEAHVAPRSSTFRRYGILLVNGVGVVDESYCGDNDIWYFPALAMRDTVIEKDERICQFRIMPKMAPVTLETVACLDGPNRGGLGSTGTK